MTSVLVEGFPDGTTSSAVYDHFCDRANKGGTLQYVLYPMLDDATKAVVTFRDAKGRPYYNQTFSQLIN